jgi:uncharacterized circularly permuted ATP-grasp superfamily protein
MPEIIRFLMGEEPILKTVPTWRCRECEGLAYVLDHLSELVVKRVDGSGGYGMLIGPHATRAELETFGKYLRANPERYIAQPTLALSTCPTFVENGIAPRHVDLRPFVLTGTDGVRIVPGGLTRVAMRQGSLVVNSSQGGGTKDPGSWNKAAPPTVSIGRAPPENARRECLLRAIAITFSALRTAVFSRRSNEASSNLPKVPSQAHACDRCRRAR